MPPYVNIYLMTLPYKSHRDFKNGTYRNPVPYEPMSLKRCLAL